MHSLRERFRRRPLPGAFNQAAQNALYEIDWDHPLARGLVHCAVLGSPLVSNRELARGNRSNTSHAWATSERGGCGATGWSNATTGDLAFTSGAFTVGCVARIPATVPAATYPVFVSRYAYTSESVNAGWRIWINGDAGSAEFDSFGNVGFASYALTATQPAAGVRSLVGTSDGTTRRLYFDGVQQATTTNQPNPTDATGNLSSGSAGSVSGTPIASYIAFAYNRELSAQELIALHADWFACAVPKRRSIMVGAIAAAVRVPWWLTGQVAH